MSYHLIGNSITDYAFLVAERFLKIPSFGTVNSVYVLSQSNNEVVIGNYFREQTSRKKIFLENVRQFFEKKNVGSENNIKASRGINFLKKCYFLIRTLRSIQKSHLEVIVELFEQIKLFYHPPSAGFQEKYNCDLMFTENNSSVDFLVNSGLKRENIRVIGNPVFDIYQKKYQKRAPTALGPSLSNASRKMLQKSWFNVTKGARKVCFMVDLLLVFSVCFVSVRPSCVFLCGFLSCFWVRVVVFCVVLSGFLKKILNKK